jgi:hypothetical protein
MNSNRLISNIFRDSLTLSNEARLLGQPKVSNEIFGLFKKKEKETVNLGDPEKFDKYECNFALAMYDPKDSKSLEDDNITYRIGQIEQNTALAMIDVVMGEENREGFLQQTLWEGALDNYFYKDDFEHNKKWLHKHLDETLYKIKCCMKYIDSPKLKCGPYFIFLPKGSRTAYKFTIDDLKSFDTGKENLAQMVESYKNIKEAQENFSKMKTEILNCANKFLQEMNRFSNKIYSKLKKVPNE